jgi:flagellar biosynthetic protein FliR
VNAQLEQFAPLFVLIVARVGGMIFAAPVFGSSAVPKVVRAFIALVIALGIYPAISPPTHWPQTTGGALAAIAGEMIFGVTLGLSMRLVFVAVQWAGEIIGQQMGIGVASAFAVDTETSAAGGIYSMLTLVVFLIAGGHRAMLAAMRASFDTVPIMATPLDRSLLDMLLATFQISMAMLIRLAAPVLITMLIVDFVIGFAARSVPQIANFAGGMTLRPIIGIALVGLCMAMSADVIIAGIKQSMWIAENSWARLAGQ